MTIRLLAILALLLFAAPARGQVGCQSRPHVMNSWVAPSDGPWDPALSFGPSYFGPGYGLDYPGEANGVTIEAFSGGVMRFNAAGQPKPNGAFVYVDTVPRSLQPYDREAVQFYGYLWRQDPQTWTVVRDFGPAPSASMNVPLAPFDQFYAAASNAYPAAVWVRWVLHVVVC